MTLSCNSQWTKKTYGPGIYINEVTVAGAEDISGQPLPFRDQPFDIGIKLTLDIGRDFQPEMIIGGNFKIENGNVLGWGGAFVVQEALSKLGYVGSLEPDNKIPAHVLPSLVGKKFLRLSYVSGLKADNKPRYSDWNILATVEEGPESLANRFRKSLSRGYLKNYRPQVLDEVTALLDAEPVVDHEAF